MKILVTGSNGFVGKNLIVTLKQRGYDVLTFDKDNSASDLMSLTQDVEFVVHLAGVNRPQNVEDFYHGNADLTQILVDALQSHNNRAPILVSSSIQASMDNDYGKSKLAGEQIVLDHATQMGSRAYIYRFPNLFGKWSIPNYNTVIATWCYNIARDLPIVMNDPSVMLDLIYIDDVVQEIMNAIEGKIEIQDSGYYEITEIYKVSLQTIHDLLQSFKTSRHTLMLPNLDNLFEKKLYSTYLSFLPTDQFSYPLTMHSDDRGSFTEFIKSPDRGQVSINVSKPGITKGEHWHHTKNEKFLVVKGQGVIQLRNIFSDEILEYHVSGELLEVVDIPVGYTHNIINKGNDDMVTVMWVNEIFDPLHPDTYFEEV